MTTVHSAIRAANMAAYQKKLEQDGNRLVAEITNLANETGKYGVLMLDDVFVSARGDFDSAGMTKQVGKARAVIEALAAEQAKLESLLGIITYQQDGNGNDLLDVNGDPIVDVPATQAKIEAARVTFGNFDITEFSDQFDQ